MIINETKVLLQMNGDDIATDKVNVIPVQFALQFRVVFVKAKPIYERWFFLPATKNQ